MGFNTKNFVKILGIGASINEGLKYNSFVINKNFLVECPPDIICSIKAAKLNINKIEFLFISHFHADHLFGLPFLILNLFYSREINIQNEVLTIIGPIGIKEQTYKIFNFAYSKNHKAWNWMLDHLIFFEINKKKNKFLAVNFDLTFYELDHSNIPCYGFIYRKEKSSLGYIADTKWCSNVGDIFKQSPNIIISDMLGIENEFRNTHIGYSDIIKGYKLSGNKTRIFATHLMREVKSRCRIIKYVRPCKTIEF